LSLSPSHLVIAGSTIHEVAGPPSWIERERVGNISAEVPHHQIVAIATP
jgi:hypothetical protein